MNNSIALRDRFLELQKILEAQLIVGRDLEYKLTALQRNITAVLTKHHMRPSEVIDHGARSLARNSLVSRTYIPFHGIDPGNTKSYQAKPREIIEQSYRILDKSYSQPRTPSSSIRERLSSLIHPAV